MTTSSRATVVIGTRKGLVLARREGSTWTVDQLRFPLQAVYGVGVDNRGATPRLYASLYSEWMGVNLVTSDDLGQTWDEPAKPPVRFPERTDTALGRIWQITPGPANEPDIVYVGTEPSALFRSTDGGKSFEFVDGLWDHPHRTQWQAGYGGQAVHTVLPHPTDADRVSVAMSTGGVYRTDDGGKSWTPTNRGIRVMFMPEEYPEFGQCVHKVAFHPSNPDRMYLQNHGGVYRSDDGGAQWNPIENGLPSNFGFPIVVHPHQPDTAFLFPLEAMERMPPERRCQVWRTTDAGGSWHQLTAGLPTEPYYNAVMRDAMCADNGDPAGIYFGGRNGEVFTSLDDGESWTTIAQGLPDVLSVRALAH